MNRNVHLPVLQHWAPRYVDSWREREQLTLTHRDMSQADQPWVSLLKGVSQPICHQASAMAAKTPISHPGWRKVGSRIGSVSERQMELGEILWTTPSLVL